MAFLRRVAKVRAATLLALVLLGCMAAAIVHERTDGVAVTAYFAQTKGLYEGDSVTFLGVPIGTVTSIEPGHENVRVEMEIDGDVKLPADARAAIAAPALVTVRTVVLGPAYDGGPTLADGAEIPESRTAVPVEWDEIKTELTRFSSALGATGANRRGSVGRLVSATADYVRDQGGNINQTIRDLSEAMSTLSDNRGELFATVRNLQVFITALRESDQQVRLFNQRLATVSGAMAGDRRVLSAALSGLRHAFVDVRAFLEDNGPLTAETLHQLRSTTSVLAENRQGLADILQVAPTSVSNFYDILDPRNGAQTGVTAFENLNSPAQIICAALLNLGGQPADCETALGPLVDALRIDAPAAGAPPPLAVPGTPGATTGNSGQQGEADPGAVQDLLQDLSPFLGGGGQ
jgi:phospholipid/cholesterol/gamma-HCH transport system substrate-binding protein